MIRAAVGVVRRAWDRISIYLPVIVMAIAALGTWRLVRITPAPGAPEQQRELKHEPDYFMRDFSVKTFDAAGKLQSEIVGKVARHYPDTDTLEIDDARMRSFDPQGRLTRASAKRALSNADASEVQLFGDALVIREPVAGPQGEIEPRMEFKSEFLHTFVRTEKLTSHLPVVLTRGTDRFTGDQMEYDNLDRVMNLTGRVRGSLAPAGATKAPALPG